MGVDDEAVEYTETLIGIEASPPFTLIRSFRIKDIAIEAVCRFHLFSHGTDAVKD